MTSADLTIILPEIVLAMAAMAALLGAVYTVRDRLAGQLAWGFAGLFVALAFWIAAEGVDATAFHGLFVADAYARFAKVVVLLAAAAVLVMGSDQADRHGIGGFEYPILVALSVLGMMLMVSAADLIMLYMGLELSSLALYIIAALRRDSVRSTEAGLKYFVLGAMSSGLLLYGASLTYGFAGTTEFAGILSVLGDGAPIGLLFGLVFLLAGLAFKISAVPFHMWTPDVYEGAPTPVTAFFATAPKMAAIVLIGRLVVEAFGTIPGDWQQVVAALSVASMFLGAIAGIGQMDFKRLMAYSSIAHMGYALMGLAAGTTAGIQSMLVYMAIYVTMNVGTFAFILAMERDGRPIADIRSLNMYGRAEPAKALALMVLLFSLAGVPPFVGFFAKYTVLMAAIDADLAWLAVAGVVAAVIGAFYYLRIIYYMYFGQEETTVSTPMGPAQYALLMVPAIVMLAGIVNLFGVEGAALAAARAIVP